MGPSTAVEEEKNRCHCFHVVKHTYVQCQPSQAIEEQLIFVLAVVTFLVSRCNFHDFLELVGQQTLEIKYYNSFFFLLKILIGNRSYEIYFISILFIRLVGVSFWLFLGFLYFN